jgi:hypothetical protein
MNWSDAVLIPGIAISAVWWTNVVGLCAAWIRLRNTRPWIERPRRMGNVKLLEEFIGGYIVLSAIFGGIVGLAAWVGTAFS